MVGFRFLLDSGSHVADAVTEAPAARDVDDPADAAPSKFGNSRGARAGPFGATWAENPDASRLGMIPGAVTVFKFTGHRPASINKFTIILTSTELGVGWEWMH